MATSGSTGKRTSKATTPEEVRQQRVSSLEEMKRAQLRTAIDDYRKLVHRSAAGEVFTAEDYSEVQATLDAMHLPELAWTRDVANCKAMHDARTLEVKLRPEVDAAAKRCEELTGTHGHNNGEIAAAERRVKELREELHRNSTVIPMKLVRAQQKQTELVAASPHVFASMDDAVAARFEVARRLDAQLVAASGPAPKPSESWQ